MGLRDMAASLNTGTPIYTYIHAPNTIILILGTPKKPRHKFWETTHVNYRGAFSCSRLSTRKRRSFDLLNWHRELVQQ